MKVNELIMPTLAGVLLSAGVTVTCVLAAAAVGLPCTDSAPANDCVPGGGTKATDCNVEWSVSPAPARDIRGIPKNKLTCYEGDPRCDFDPDVTNASCTFHVGLCINNTDPRLPTCQATELAGIQVLSPNMTSLNM